MTELRLPELGEGVHEGELVKWRVKSGDSISDDQVLCEIMTDKATVEFPSPVGGKVGELLAKEGEMVKVGQVILSYKASDKDSDKAKGAGKAPAEKISEKAPVSVPSGGGVRAAPSTRRFARESGVDLASIRGSGPEGRVMRVDVERAKGDVGVKGDRAVPAAVPTAREERVPFRGLRRKIAERMRISKDKAAHFTYVEEADATELVILRQNAKRVGERQGVKVTYLPFVMKAMVKALQKYPILNSTLDEEKGELVYKHYFNIGLSIQTEDGLVAPVVKDVGNKSVMELAREVQSLVERARAKKLSLDDLQGGTITLTNAGSIGGLFATPIINYPEVAILGFNKIFKKAVVKNIHGHEEIVIRDWTYFSISLDHRVVDGAIGAEFMKEFIRYIEAPSLFWLEEI